MQKPLPENLIEKIKQGRSQQKNPSENLASALKDLIVKSLLADKAEDLLAIDLQGKSDLADYIVIATGRVNKHIFSMADKLTDKIDEAGYGHILVEGDAKSDWVLLDAYDVIVHLFTHEARKSYNIEELWKI